ncbi:MAG: MaoC family dehydratase N-terminal domain-containing protein [Acidobacteria bacterium]|nr:MaoC family dehydratase N-terminal domain-containing protein [Acidobacteriota bacterium]
MPLNFELAGKMYESDTIEISGESIAAYAAASRIDNPRHEVGPEQVPSLIYPVVIGLPMTVAVSSDPELGVDNPLMIVHGEQDMIFHRPMRPGETLVFTPLLESVEDKGKGATYVSKVTATTSDGEVVNEQLSTIFVRGAGSGTERPKSNPTAPPAHHHQVASFTKHVDQGMPEDYAAASGDHNPIHTDPGVAVAVGLPGVINHGLGTLSIVSGGLVDQLAEGDPVRIRRIQVRFTDMVIPGSDLETSVFSSDGGSFIFETTRPDGKVVMMGVVEVKSG